MFRCSGKIEGFRKYCFVDKNYTMMHGSSNCGLCNQKAFVSYTERNKAELDSVLNLLEHGLILKLE